ncbi:tripartite tricarboxylate transporter substrate binding protein [Roseomonas sp. PWR1]|uniref:Tripartite tricarboxylate transporter substrate binding protein n=1 Tax=Roseomonas nitratireducens TaxID=2820810 RepID=A0ABS4ARE2_9PROT|nr:tripartite tricarboxylate transporter substrate binding protein [Neoroseomonas nitratireducens]MBP0463923.1 tripartite tricarboxylate transporter substrate binding protein [Neoroseomonas nitratireducens]
MLSRRLLLATPALIALHRPALAAYPDRPIRVIVPFAAGGNTDILARILAAQMAERLGRPMVIENRTGAGGSVGAEFVAKATADGYTLLFGAGGPLTANPVLQANIPYDVLRDFRPIGLVGILPMICQVGARTPARSLTDLLALMRARPGQVTVATPGSGSAAHLALELVMAGANVRATHVPYRGGSAMIPDLINGTVDAGMVELPSALPQHRDGSAPIVAIAAMERSPVLPGVQTFIEAGLPGFTAGSYGGLLAPAGVPADVTAALSRALLATLEDAGVVSRIAEVGAVPSAPAQRTPEGFAAFLAQELDNARRAAQLAGLRPS